MKRNTTRKLDNKSSIISTGKESKKVKLEREKKVKMQSKIIIENEKLITSYKILSLDLDKNINEILNIASRGDFSEISDKYKEEDFFDIFDDIDKKKKYEDSYEHYEKIRNMSKRIIQSVWKSIYQYRELKTALGEIDSLNEKAEILDDPDKLKQYIEDLTKKIQPVIPDQTITLPVARIKEPYYTYIQVFGLPDKAQFDIVLLKYLDVVLKERGKEEAMIYLKLNKEGILEQLEKNILIGN